MSKKLVLTSAILICIAIILGAMAAHGLKNKISEELIESFQKGVTYQFYAGFSLLILGLTADKFSFSLNPFFWLMLIGVILFSGCIYLYCFHAQIPALHSFVLIVPFGGVCMIAAWVVFIFRLIRN